ncbi:hypothetical protein VOLCADRAFT_120420 [Volvox carteri f. nagariensis]|uniref:ubiquitinyl hydrolase 1 n=1 Tax=Volvox carteri f. nagariensis TaxID=3068 RepID=D8TKZ7_VOLCA|nr:uncharacterized protein VOLCADRAFT_120420 [Volvox carteri f. nagariensis]EFJ51647.1 hypothetical protein VOLCADRAFT_120420 [Volvox carteri f. nagariensis]|eukprot:XP_002947057.1 hypothetical protein VOLCADRAFT_120420 [Volvox carteri f. nagariensis]
MPRGPRSKPVLGFLVRLTFVMQTQGGAPVEVRVGAVPLAPNANLLGEPTNSGILSLGRPRQQPLNTVNNVQSSRKEAAEAAQAHAPGSSARKGDEGVLVAGASQQQIDSATALEPVSLDKPAPPEPVAKAELSTQNEDARTAPEPEPAPVTGNSEVNGLDLAASLESGRTIAEATSLMGSAAIISSSSGSACGSSNYSDTRPSSVALHAPAAAHSLGEVPAGGPTQCKMHEKNVTMDDPEAVTAPVIPTAESHGAPQRDAVPSGTGVVQAPAEKQAVPAGGIAWRQGPATALFAAAGSAAGGRTPSAAHGPNQNTIAPPTHATAAPKASAGATSTTAAAAASSGMHPAPAAASELANSGSRQNHVPHSPTSAASEPSSQTRNRTTHLQAGNAPRTRCPPPGFGVSAVALGPSGSTDSQPSGQAVTSAEVDNVQVARAQSQQSQQQQQAPTQLQRQMSPRAGAGSADASAPDGSRAQRQQHSPERSATAAVASAPSVPAVPSSANGSDVPKASRKWASVAAAPASSGGVQTKALPHRPNSEGGSSDTSAAAAAATLVGLRHSHQPSARQPPSVTPGVSTASAAAALASEVKSKTAGRSDSVEAPGVLAEGAPAAPVPVAGSETAAAKWHAAPVAAVLRAAPQAAQKGHGQQDLTAPQPGASTPASAPAPCLKVEHAAVKTSARAVAAAAAVAESALGHPSGDVATAAAVAAVAAALASSPRESARSQIPVASDVISAANQSDVTSISSSTEEAPATRTRAGIALSHTKDSADGQRAPTGSAAGTRHAINAHAGNATPGPAGAAAGPGLSAATASKPVALPTDASVRKAQQAVSVVAAAPTSAPAASETEGSPAAGEVCAPEQLLPPAATVTPAAPAPVPVAATAKLPTPAAVEATASPAAEPLASEPAAAAPGPRSWAALAASGPSGSAAPQTGRGRAPRGPAALGRGTPGRGSRQLPASQRIAAQPPEVMFHHCTTATSPQVAGARGGVLTPTSVAEDGYPPAASRPGMSSAPSGPTSSAGKPAPPSLSVGAEAVLSPTQGTLPVPSPASAAPGANFTDATCTGHAAASSAGAQAAPSDGLPQQSAPAPVPAAAPAPVHASAGSAATGDVLDSSGPGAVSPAALANDATIIAAAVAAPLTAAAQQQPPAPESHAGAVEPGAEGEGEGDASRQGEGGSILWTQVIKRKNPSKGPRDMDTGYTHSRATVAAVGSRGRGKHGDAAAAAPPPRQRDEHLPPHRSLLSPSAAPVTAGAQQHGPQLSGKPCAIATGLPTAVAAAVTTVTIPSPSVPPLGPTAGDVKVSGAATEIEAGPDGAVPLLASESPQRAVCEGASAATTAVEAPSSVSKVAAAAVPAAEMGGKAAPASVGAEPVVAAAAAPEVEAVVETSVPDVAEAGVEDTAIHGKPAAPPAPADDGVGAPIGVVVVSSAVAALAQADTPDMKITTPEAPFQARDSGASTKDKDGLSAASQAVGPEGREEKVEEGEDDGAAAIPAGRNPWDLLGTAGEDGEMTEIAVAAAGMSASAAASGASALIISAASTSEAEAMEALRQLLTPATAEQLLAGSRQQQQAGKFRILPRGLKNTGNTCFINATMQALLACAPFASVLSRLPAVAPVLEPSKSPTLHGLALLLAELVAPQPGVTTPSSAGAAGSGRDEAQLAAEDDGWAEVQVSRGKKAAQRRNNAAKPVLQPTAPTAPAPSSGPSASGKEVVLGGQPLVPSMLSGIAAAFNPRISIAEKQTMAKVLSKSVVEQEQQDAQEFFQFLVNRVHEEVLGLRKAHGLAAAPAAASASAAGGSDDGEEWSQVGRKNKATVTRQVGTPADDASSRSPVTAIFSGLVKSTIRFQQPHANYKPSATIEVFNMLHLDIAAEGVNTLEDALRHHSVPENIEYKPEGASEMLPAKKDVRLYRLPEVLVLHLKRFTYTAAGGGHYTKLQKSVAFNCLLRLEGKVLAEDCPDRANAEYRLFATINHHGRSIAGGHYIADVQQPDGCWLRFNDEHVLLVSEGDVLRERPYLLFYQRVPQRAHRQSDA